MPRKSLFVFCLLVVATFLAPKPAHAQTYTESVLYNFCSTNITTCSAGSEDAYPYAGVVQAMDGNFYGTTEYGGNSNAAGAVYRITPSGTLTTIYSFCAVEPCADGEQTGAIVQGSDGNFYGTTQGGGLSSTDGTVFKITPSGTLTTLYEFCSLTNCADGSGPIGALVQGSDGNFYGVTASGGAQNSGTAFMVTPSGTLTTIYNFCSQASCTDGTGLYTGLLQGSDGNFYGTTTEGGVGDGTVFELTPSGTLTTLYGFCTKGGSCSDGNSPKASLVEASDGNFYGSTFYGGPKNAGTIFKITRSGTLTTLYNFCSEGGTVCTDGGNPNRSALIVGSDGNFYGTTSDVTNPGSDRYGTIFQMTPSGSVTTLFNFCGESTGVCDDGEYPQASLVQGSNGNFYGVTFEGGVNNSGTTFELSVAPSLAAPVQLTFSSASTSVGNTVTLTWKVLNGFSLTMQQCYAFVANGATGAGSWTGLQTGSLVDGAYTGSASITPTVAGDYTYALTCGGVESGFGSLNVGTTKAATTTMLTTNSPVALNGSVTLTATVVTSPYSFPVTGTVAFKYGSTSLGTVTPVNGVATLDVSANGIPAGTYPISATYSGNTNYDASSGTANLVIVGYATSATLTTSANKITQGQSVTLTSTVKRTSVSGTPTGTVTFYSGTLELGSATLVSGTATFTAATSGSIPSGTYPITAKYSGDASDQTATSPTVSITLLAATATTLTASPNPVPADSSVTITITVKEKYGTAFPTGTVTLSVGSNTLGSPALADGVATVNASDFNYPAGTYAVTATYSGDAHNAASSGTLNIVVQ